MDAKYLAEIKAREQAAKDVLAKAELRYDTEYRPLLEAISDIPALLTEVERLNAYESIDLLPEQIEAMQGHNIALIEENAAKDQQIATLERALEYACADRATTPSMWQDLQKKYMEIAHQAQEREGKK